MDRRETLLAMFDASGFGLEIGPSYNPLLPKAEGYRVETLDHLDKTALLEKYGAAGVDTSKIEEVDFVLDGRSLVEMIGEKGRYDFIFASHVIEHTPDMLGFLKACEELLKPAGVLVLAVPDKRYCFDFFHRLSSTGEIVETHRMKRWRPGYAALFDTVAYGSKLDGAIGWPSGTTGTRTFAQSLADAARIAEHVERADVYRDVHVWRFVPSSFRLIINDLYEIGEIGLRETAFHASDEFFIAMSRAGPGPQITRLALCEEAIREQASAISVTDSPPQPLYPASDTAQSTEIYEREIARLNEEISTLRRSTSWKATAPFRHLVQKIRRA